jgi:hypothetical protein
MKRFFILSILFSWFTVCAQQDFSTEYAETISISELTEYLNILASDALEGRETGEAGQQMAAAYIQHFFKNNGLEPIVYTSDGPSFYQKFELVSLKPGEAWIKVKDKNYNNFEDIVYTGNTSLKSTISAKPVFVGSGSEQDYSNINVANKSVLIYCRGDRIDRNKKFEIAIEKGAAYVFIIQDAPEDAFKRTLGMYKRYMSHGRLTFPKNDAESDNGYFMLPKSIGLEILNISEKKLEDIIDKSEEGNYKNLLKVETDEIEFYIHQDLELVETENVLGFIEGSDLKDEYIIITAHYDHVGKNNGEVYNGADDDGSGTVAVLEIAQAFALAKANGHGPRRSILFMTVTGEEKGLLGSSYYVNNPVLPLEKTITNLNIDMIGRVDEAHKEDSNYVYLIGSDKLSLGLHHLSEKVNSTYTKINLDYKFNDENDPNRFYYRSDHYNFAKNNIPIIFYFNGTHADYHKATDTVDKIEFELLQKRTKLVFHTAWEIANRDERISVDVFPKDIKLNETK